MTATATFSARATAAYERQHNMRPDEAAGLRHLTTVGGSGLVGIYRSAEAGLDDEGMPWSTVCEIHAHVIGHTSFKLAHWHAPDVRSWCEGCMAEAEDAEQWLELASGAVEVSHPTQTTGEAIP